MARSEEFGGVARSPHKIECGPGERDFLTAGPRDLVNGESCEHVAVGDQTWAFNPRLPPRWTLGFFGDGIQAGTLRYLSPGQTARATVTAGRTVVAERVLAPRHRISFRRAYVPFTSAGRALLERRRVLRVRVSVTGGGAAPSGSFLMDLRAPTNNP
jgi:ribosomal protein L34